MASRLLSTTLAFALALAPLTALAAEPTAADRETARALMAEGRQKRDANELKAALKAFRGADALMHVPTTGYEVAKTEALAGELVEARDHALTVARSTPKPGEPAPFAEARTAADALAAELEGRIPSLKIVISGAKEEEVEVRLDDTVIPAAALGLPRKLNPGAHVVVAKNGSDVRKTTVEVNERETKETTIDFATAAPPPPPPDDPPNPNEPHPPEEPSTPGNPLRTGLIAGGFGVAAVGTILGSITGGMSLSKTSTLKEQCPNDLCPPALEDELGSARTLATVSTISFVFAGAGLVTGLVALLALKNPEPASATAPSASARVTPWIGLGSVGLSGTF
jgi:hypothetical protein